MFRRAVGDEGVEQGQGVHGEEAQDIAQLIFRNTQLAGQGHDMRVQVVKGQRSDAVCILPQLLHPRVHSDDESPAMTR